MRVKIIVLLLIGGAAYYWWSHRAPTAAASDNPFETNPVATPVAPLPATALKALDEADSLWSQAGGDHTHSPVVPRMARLYSQVLLAMYDLSGQHDAREDRKSVV